MVLTLFNIVSTSIELAVLNPGKGNFSTDVQVIGGGLAGLVAAILLNRYGWSVTLFEKKQYPFHRVCGEYISNETVPFLREHGLFPDEFNPETISRLQLTSVSGRSAEINLDMGGFGISRFAYDHFLYKKAVEAGVKMVHETVEHIDLNEARVIIGAHGKRSKVDYTMDREFVHRRSPYVGVKYHIKVDHPTGLIALHNFKDGYCGISNVEDGRTNLCYLTSRDNLKKYGNIETMQREVLYRNPFLKDIFSNAEFLLQKPEVINEISFATKKPVENHVLMIGDAAGMITPLCGNGMAMAIHSAKVVSAYVNDFLSGKITRQEMESNYEKSWRKLFAKRLWVGRQVQRLFGSEGASNFAVDLVRNVKPVANFLVDQTHGEIF
ncbi:MAG: NAD(P)/FAD-dependent oxidoreductase [Bacteroidota bacterium]